MIWLNLLFHFILMAEASNTCSAEQVFNHRGIDCCINGIVTQEQCAEKIDQFSPKLLNSFKKTRQDIVDGVFPEKRFPNCYWATMAFISPSALATPKYVEAFEILPWLEQNTDPVSTLQKHDLILFSGIQVFPEDPVQNLYREVLVPFHSAVWLGDGWVLHKENYTDDVFSIVPYETALKAYNKSHQEQFGTPLTPQFFRRKTEN